MTTALEAIMNVLISDETLVNMVDGKIISSFPLVVNPGRTDHDTIIGVGIKEADIDVFRSDHRDATKQNIVFVIEVLSRYGRNNSYAVSVMSRVRELLFDNSKLVYPDLRLYVDGIGNVESSNETNEWSATLEVSCTAFQSAAHAVEDRVADISGYLDVDSETFSITIISSPTSLGVPFEIEGSIEARFE